MNPRNVAFALLAASTLASCKDQQKPNAAASRQTTEAASPEPLQAGGPEAAAKVYGDAIRSSDWAAAARLMHPSALKQWRALFEPLFSTPDMQESVTQIFGVPPSALAGTPDTVLFAAFLKNVLAQQEGLSEALNSAQITPLGHVAVGDTMLVVSRTAITMEGTTLTQFDVMPFIQENGQWWALLKSDVANMAAMIQKAMTQRRS